eukprot:2456325-Prymnesium_polylepis.1
MHNPTWPEGRTKLSPRVCVAVVTYRPFPVPGNTFHFTPTVDWQQWRLRPSLLPSPSLLRC